MLASGFLDKLVAEWSVVAVQSKKNVEEERQYREPRRRNRKRTR
jgi:hypothetical protein